MNNDITCATNTDEACVRVQDTNRALYARNRAYNSVGLKTCYRMYDGTVNALMIDNYCVKPGTTSGALASFEILSTGEIGEVTDHRGDISNVHLVDNKEFWDGTYSSVVTSFGGQSSGSGGPGPYTCDDVVSDGNELITSDGTATYGESFTNCTNVVTDGGTTTALSALPWDGSVPTCATIGCGPS